MGQTWTPKQLWRLAPRERILMQNNIDGSASLEHTAQDAVLHQSEHTRIFRRRLTEGGSIICKESLRANALERLRHEKKVIERLAGIEGVSRIARGPCPTTAIALEDCDGVSLAQVLRTERLELPALLTLMSQLSHIVAAMHRAGAPRSRVTPLRSASRTMRCSSRSPTAEDFEGDCTTIASLDFGFSRAGTFALPRR